MGTAPGVMPRLPGWSGVEINWAASRSAGPMRGTAVAEGVGADLHAAVGQFVLAAGGAFRARSLRGPARQAGATGLHCFRALGFVPQHQHRHAECRRLFLQAARVGQHQRGADQRLLHLQVVQRGGEFHVGMPVENAVRSRVAPPGSGGPGNASASADVHGRCRRRRGRLPPSRRPSARGDAPSPGWGRVRHRGCAGCRDSGRWSRAARRPPCCRSCGCGRPRCLRCAVLRAARAVGAKCRPAMRLIIWRRPSSGNGRSRL